MVIPEGVTEISRYLFNSCTNLSSIQIPNNVTRIGQFAFNECESLKSLSFLKEGIFYIDGGAFQACSGLKEIVLPKSVGRLGYYAFAACAEVERIEIPNVQEIPLCAFTSNKVKTIVIPNSVTKIDEMAFGGCSQLLEVTIGSSVQTIGQNAFYDCSSIKKVTTYAQTPPTCSTNSFARTDIVLNETVLEVPKGTVSTYKNKSVWNYFNQVNELPDPCASPTIEWGNGEILITCPTEGAEFHYSIKSDDVKTGILKEGRLPINAKYEISVYATAEGYRPSEIVTKTVAASSLDGTKGDMNNDGRLTISDITKLVDAVKIAK